MPTRVCGKQDFRKRLNSNLYQLSVFDYINELFSFYVANLPQIQIACGDNSTFCILYSITAHSIKAFLILITLL